MTDRIKQIIECEGISIRAFEIKISASNGLIRKAITNHSDIQSKWIKAIVDNFPQYNIGWLVTGEGEMFKNARSYDEVTPSIRSNSVNNNKEHYNINDKEGKFIEILASQQRVIESQCEIIAELTQKKSGTNANGNSASSA